MSQANAVSITERSRLSRRAILTAATATLAGSAAVALPIAAQAAGGSIELPTSPDANLTELLRLWRESENREIALIQAMEEAEDRYLAARPAIPEALFEREGDRDLTMPRADKCLEDARRWYNPGIVNDKLRGRRFRHHVDYPVTDEIRAAYKLPEGTHTLSLLEPWDEARDRAGEIIEALDNWDEECRRFKVSTGFVAAEDAWRAESEVNKQIRQKIVETPAKTLQGALMKMEIVSELCDGAEGIDQYLSEQMEQWGPTADNIGISVLRDLARIGWA